MNADDREIDVKSQPHTSATMSIAEAIAAASETDYVPVTFEACGHVDGPFFHGTKITLNVGDHLVAGRQSNYQRGRVSNHVYFASLLEPAVWAAELAVALAIQPLANPQGPGRIYVVEPTGPFEDDPNVTNKKFPGNVTRSFRTRDPMRIIGEVHPWEGHPPEILEAMLDNLAQLRDTGRDIIED
jgi:Rifampin ADP-ribosyl transferase